MKTLITILCLCFLLSQSYAQKTAEEWRAIIDTTWGEGLPTADKLQIFDLFWNTIDADYAGFNNLDINWDSLKNVYRPEIAAGVSRGRFAAIMNQLVMALMEIHTHCNDAGVREDSLHPGVPLLAYHSAYTVYDNGHFGAGLTPLPDSSALVYKVVDNHPLGLVAGDIILGYDGIPWKYLYPQLLAAELPITGPAYISPGSSIKSNLHMWLMSAGLNWHLFDTIDILKYGSNDTVHFSTSILVDKNMHILCSEQLPVPGVPMVDLSDWEESSLVSWGIVEETQLGYIYVSRWRDNEGPAFTNAVNAIINDHQTTGLILDFRGNPGGEALNANGGLSRLFNFNLNILEFAERSDPDDHFALRPVSSGYCRFNNHRFQADNYLYDRPIAVLTGPGTFSHADINSLRLKYHPMVKIFGKPTNTAFTCYTVTFHNLTIPFQGWLAGYAPRNTYLSADPNNYLIHVGFEVDEEVWLTQEDVAKGEDTVVKRAIEWIQNLSHAHDVNVNKSYTYIKPGIDTVLITANVENPNDHPLKVQALFIDSQNQLADSTLLFDDGKHNDGSANDDYWGGFFVPNAEETYRVDVQTIDNISGTSRRLPRMAHFTSMGPIVFEEYLIFGSDTIPNPGVLLRLKLKLKNNGLTATAPNIIATLSSPDSCVTFISATATFDDIAPGDSSTHGWFMPRFSKDCPVNKPIPFRVDIASNFFTFWSDTFSIRLLPTTIDEKKENIPREFVFGQNYPNPFNPSTTIKYALPKSELVTITVYNTLGQKLETLLNKPMPIGHHQVDFNGQDLPSGVYFYRIEAGEYIQTRKLLLVR